ncbi:hypothetical protein WALSEDRAFT_32332 [Wallemia mellicola CBS 633.66]|uniref:Uncharacterized protein n=1 Tax=Wallemia mellicola (strain ATCC MYA-4683 / CBS 633.66) TaxID=671144 RepID=I4YCN8_WALMC|nr:hypothetical protein WALSEDRAFT_32332 [Wallemia mellicola CBS 633.66]EIM21730.1 hypothetical protein WALSEDRAFT_32332 [Wallemia mellicola CBS 633.66]|eukprot:XP_006958041.1 hypothetical protein WALSEDRAFT_32332 [Wallemia mellicola CBS 633.66]
MSTSSLSSPESERESKKLIINYHDKSATKRDDDSLSEASTQPLSPPRSKSSSDLSEPPEDRIKMSKSPTKIEPSLTSALDPIPTEIATELAKDPPPEAVAAPTTEKEVGAGEALLDMAVEGEMMTESPTRIDGPADHDDNEKANTLADSLDEQKMEVEDVGQQDDVDQQNDIEQEDKTDIGHPEEHEDERDDDQEKPDDESERNDEDEEGEAGEGDEDDEDAPTNAAGGSSTAYHVDDEREEALAFLTKLEIEFAMLRNKLYVERMEEVAKESAMIADGTHPELQHLHNILKNRRDTRLSLASVRLKKLEESYKTTFQAEQESAWTNWVERVKQLHFGQGDAVESGSFGWGYGLQGNDRKRRRLEREKRTLELPKIVRHEPISQLAQKTNEQHELLPPPILPTANQKKGKKRGRHSKKDYINEAKQKVSVNTWQDINSSFGEALSNLDDVQLSSQAVDEDLLVMREKHQELTTHRDRLHSTTDTQQNSPLVSNYPSPTSLPAALTEQNERPGYNRGYSLDSAPAEAPV